MIFNAVNSFSFETIEEIINIRVAVKTIGKNSLKNVCIVIVYVPI